MALSMATTSSGSPKSTNSKSFLVLMRKDKPLNSQSRELVLNVYNNLRKQEPGATVSSVIDRTSVLTGVPVPVIRKIKSSCENKQEDGKVHPESSKPPGKNTAKGANTKPEKETLLNSKEKRKLTDSDRRVIRRVVHDFYLRNEVPTSSKVLNALRDTEPRLPFLRPISLGRMLKDIGFENQRRFKTNLLIDRVETVAQRRQYLKLIRQYREEGRRLYYIDETVIPLDLMPSSEPQSDQSASQSTDKLVICHAAGGHGFVANAFEMFVQNSSHHLDSTEFESWFRTKLLPNILRDSVIILNDATHHNEKLEKIPDGSWMKQDIQQWLTNHKVFWHEDSVKVELLHLVAGVSHRFRTSRIDALAALQNTAVLRIPAFHNELNLMEQFWSYLIKHIKSKSTSDGSLQDVVHKLVSSTTAEHFKLFVQQLKVEEEKMWDVDNIIEEIYENFIDFGSDSDDDDSDTSTADEQN